MDVKSNSQKQKRSGSRGQAMVEFAIALPVLLLLLYGIMEVGRFIFMYALVTNSSRDAVRYASAIGRGDNGLFKYNDCATIESVARQSAYIVPLNSVSITYDLGPGNSSFASCSSSVVVDTGVRVTVESVATYAPIIKFLPLRTFDIKSKSSRTILGVFDLPNK